MIDNLLKDSYNFQSIDDVISFENYKKTFQQSYNLYCTIFKGKPYLNYSSFIFKFTFIIKQYPSSDLAIKELREYYKRKNKDFNKKNNQ